MNKEREYRMLAAAAFLANSPIDKLEMEDIENLLEYGTIAGSFACVVRWADNNPASPWVNINKMNPESCVPRLNIEGKKRKYIKVLLRFKDGSIMESHRVRLASDESWIWGIPARMQEQVTHWMYIPPIPKE